MSDRPTDELDLPPILAGRYEVGRVLGAGGMGVVCLGRQLGLDRKVAIKVLQPSARLSQKAIARFKREALAVKRLTHPNTVRIYDFGETEDGILFIVMEYLEGCTLREELARAGPMPPKRVARLARQALKSLIEAHSHQIIHRDLKPANIMLCEQLGEGELLKVLDFGIARLNRPASPVTPDTNTLLGTPWYMSPEQVRGDPIDSRSDLYSLGLTLLELLTGRLPIDEDSPIRVALAHASERPLPLPPEIDMTPLGGVIRCAVAKDPGDRYGSAEEMLADLDRRWGGEAGDTLHEPHQSGAATLDLRGPGPSPAAPAVSDVRARSRLRRWALATATLVALGAVAVALATRRGSDSREISEDQSNWSQRVRLTRLTGNPLGRPIMGASLTADGLEVAYFDREGLWTIPAGGRAPAQHVAPTTSTLMHVSWFADQRRLLASNDIGDFGPMWEVDRQTGERRVLHPDAGLGRVSPDGGTVAYQTDFGIWAMGLDDGEAVSLVRGPPQDVRLLGWSPNGAHVTYYTRPDEDTFAVTRDGLRTYPIASGIGALIAGPSVAWLDDERVLYTRSTGAGTLASQVCQARLSTSPQGADGVPEEDDCPISLDNPLQFTSNLQGGRILSRVYEANYDVYVAPLSGDRLAEQPRRLTMDDRPDIPGVWLDPARFAFASGRTGSWQAFTQQLDSRDAQPLFTDGEALTLPAALDPDGQLMSWRIPWPDRGDFLGCELVRQDQQASTQVIATLHPTQPCFDPSAGIGAVKTTARFDLRCGRSLCVLLERAAELTTMSAFDWRTGRVDAPFYIASTGDSSVNWDLSPDGRLAAMIRAGTSELIFLPVASPDDRRVVALEPGGWAQFVAFDADADGVYVSGMQFSGNTYALLHCEFSGACELVWTREVGWINNPVVSPDGRHLALGLGVYDVDLWVMEGF